MALRLKSKKVLIPLAVTVLNGEMGIAAWQIARFGVLKSFIIGAVFGSFELLFWFYSEGTLLKKLFEKSVVYGLTFLAIFFGTILVLYLSKEKKLFSRLPPLYKKRLKIAAFFVVLLIVIIAFLSLISGDIKRFILSQIYLGLFICGFIPTFFHLGIGIIRAKAVGYGLIFLMAGNIAKMAVFAVFWRKLIPILGLDKINIDEGSVTDGIRKFLEFK